MAAHTVPAQSLYQLLPEGVSRAGVADVVITGVVLDSRRIQAGNLFLAVRGWKEDGRRYIPQAVANGCAAVVAEAGDFDNLCPAGGTARQSLAKAGVPLVLVPDLQGAVSEIAANFYGHPGRQLDIVGVTGTNGKTTCVSLLSQMGRLLGLDTASIGTLGWGTAADGGDALRDIGMTTPDAVRLQEILQRLRQEGVGLVAMEVSSHGLEQGRVNAAGIDCAVFTNLSRDHLDFHGSEQRYAAAKARLFTLPSVAQAVINTDDPWGAEVFAALSPHIVAVSYGLGEGAQVGASDILLSDQGASFRIRSPWGEGAVNSPLLGEFNVLNLLAVIAVYCLRGVALAQVLAQVPRLTPVKGRMQIISRPRAPKVVVDYAHTPDALRKALLSLRRHCQGELWCVFGCGGNRDQGKRPEMGGIAEQLADRVIVTSDNPRGEDPGGIIDQILMGMTQLKNVRVLADRAAAIETAVAEASADDCILIAGKGHETYQQIGDSKLPFSDMDTASAALEQRWSTTGRGQS